MWSLGFSSFRHLMDLWDEAVGQERHLDQINTLIDSNGLIMFFAKDKSVYGSPEEGRLVFAKMKDPDDGDEDWIDEASFIGYDLERALSGEKVERLFQAKDMKGLKIISREVAVKMLGQRKKVNPTDKKLKSPHGKDGAGFIQIKDRQ